MKSITRMLLASFAVLPLIPAEAFGAISVTLVGSPDPVRVFEELVQVVTVRNDGAAAVNNVVVELLTPNDTGAAGGDLSAGGVCSGGFCNEGDLATWTVGMLNSGESRVMQMSAQVLNGTADGTVLPLSVTVDYTGGSASATSVVVADSTPLRLALVESQDPVVPGGVLDYTLRYSNATGASVTSAALQFTLPAGVSLLSASNGGVQVGNEVQWNLGTLASNVNGQRSLRVQISGSEGLLLASAVLDGGTQDSADAQAATVVDADDPLSVTLVGSPDPVRGAEELVQVVTVRNDGAAAVNNVVVELLTPTSTSASSGDLSAGGVCPGGFCNPGELATWTVGTLNPGESRVMQMSALVVNLTAEGTVLPLSVTVDYTGGSASATSVVVVDSTPLRITLAADQNPVAAGDVLLYQLDWANNSTSTFSNIELSATLPDGVQFISASNGGVQNGSAITWFIGSVIAQEVGNQTLAVVIDSGRNDGELVVMDATISDNAAGKFSKSTKVVIIDSSITPFSGYVQDALTGLPISGITVNVGGYVATTDATGRYFIQDLAANTYTISVDPVGYLPYSTPINSSLASSHNFSLTPDPTECTSGTLSGVVIGDETNTNLDGVTVSLTAQSPVITSGGGAYNFGALSPSAYTITVSYGNYVPYSQTISMCGNKVWEIHLITEGVSYGVEVSTIFGDPVNTATGNYVYQRRDLEIPGVGMPFVFERSYNSRDDSIGPLGYNWTHNWNASTNVDVNGNVTIRWGDGRTETWSPDGGGGFIPQYGVFTALIDDGGGAYSVRKKDLTQYRFDSSNRLSSVVDRNGNTITLSYTGANLTQITDTAGRTISIGYDAFNRIDTITDPISRTIAFGYDPVTGDLTSAQDMRGNTTIYTYDGNHQILTIIDPELNTLVTNTYDAADRVVTYQTDAKTGGTSYVYDSASRQTTITDAESNLTIHHFDDKMRLIREDDPNGKSRFFFYDAAGNRTQVTDRNGNLTQYGYDANGNVTSKTDALDNATAITYDTINNPLTRTDALSNTTSFTYDANGNLIQTQDALLNTTAVTYNANGLPLTVTDGRGNTTTNAYDAQGNLISVQDALGSITQYTSYDGVGRRLTKVDALGRTTIYAYDNNNNLLSVTDPASNISRSTYDGNNNKLTTTDKNGNLTRFAYDEKDLLTTTTDALSGVVTNTYDAIDRRTAVQDRKGNNTRSSYDAVGNLIKVTDALTNNSQFTYDANNNRLSATDPNGNTRLSTYDALNRRTSIRDALGNTSTTAYDKLGRTISVTNAKGQTTAFSYDKLGRRSKVTDADGGTVQNTYDKNGNRVSMTDPDGNVITYAYDALNRLTTRAEPLGNTTQYQYDAIGNLNQVTRPNGDVIQYAYDNRNRLATITYPDASTVSFSYDNNGNRTRMVDSLGTQAWTHDALNRRTTHTDPFGNIVGYGYDANGNRTSLTYPDGKTVTYGYDALNRQTTVTDWLTNTTSYSYDAAGRLTGTVLPNGAKAAYGYDNANRLTSLTNAKADASVISSYSYTLDAIGNHTAEERNEPLMPALIPGTVAYTYDTENRLTDANGTANNFDNNGNLTAKGTDGYVYDYENRLTQTTIGGVMAQYQYDGLGNRYSRTRGSVTARFVLDTNTSLTSVLAETDASNNITAYNLYGLGLIARIQPDGTASYYHYDSRGSTIALTDASGATTDTYAYDPFGKPTNRTGSTDNPFIYIGRYGVIDEGDDLFYIRARYYDSEQQRFVSKDAKAGNDGDGQSLNRYVYVLNNPVRLVDVSGFSAEEVVTKPNNNFGASDKAKDHGFESIKILGITMCDANMDLIGYQGCATSIANDKVLGNLGFGLTIIKKSADVTMAAAACVPGTNKVVEGYEGANLVIDTYNAYSEVQQGNISAGMDFVAEKSITLTAKVSIRSLARKVGERMAKGFGGVLGGLTNCVAGVSMEIASAANDIGEASKNR